MDTLQDYPVQYQDFVYHYESVYDSSSALYESDDSGINSLPSSENGSPNSNFENPPSPSFQSFVPLNPILDDIVFEQCGIPIQPSEQSTLKEIASSVQLPEEVQQLFLKTDKPTMIYDPEKTTVQSRDYYKDLLYGVFNYSTCQDTNNVNDIASKLWFERMDEPIPQGLIENNYGVIYFCRQNPSPKRKDGENWIWGNDQRPDAKKDPDQVQLRYWSHENGVALRRYAMRFIEAKEKAPKEAREMDPKIYRQTPVDILREVMVVHWVKAEDGRRKRTSPDNNNDTRPNSNNDNNNDNNKPKPKRTKGPQLYPQHYTPSSSGVPCDRRLKKDIKLLPGGAMAKLARMQAVSFIYKNDPHNEETLGFIAQELQQIDSRLVTVRDGYLMLQPVALLTLLVQGHQEFLRELASHRKAIEELQQKQKQLEAATTDLQQNTVKKEEFHALKQDVQGIKDQLTPPTPKLFVIPTDLPLLHQQILTVLRDAGTPLNKRDITKLINDKKIVGLTTTPSDVNKALYQKLDRVYVDLVDNDLKKWALKTK